MSSNFEDSASGLATSGRRFRFQTQDDSILALESEMASRNRRTSQRCTIFAFKVALGEISRSIASHALGTSAKETCRTAKCTSGKVHSAAIDSGFAAPTALCTESAKMARRIFSAHCWQRTYGNTRQCVASQCLTVRQYCGESRLRSLAKILSLLPASFCQLSQLLNTVLKDTHLNLM